MIVGGALAVGIAISAVAGNISDNFRLWIPVGIAVGIAIGSAAGRRRS